MKLRKTIFLLLIILLLSLLCSCSTENSSPVAPVEDSNQAPVDHTKSVTVVVTRDFGSQLVIEENVDFEEDITAMDALQQVAEVDTKYGGGFVDAIEGISSSSEESDGQKKDWLFYINGISVKTGALSYTLHEGDIEHWDFREWSFRQFVPAIIGDFPEPFVHGYGGVIYPTVVVYQDGWQESAEQIADRLNQLGVLDVATSSVDELAVQDKETANLVLLGTGDHLLIEEVNQAWDKLGFYAHFYNGSLEIYNAAGDLTAENDTGTGVIQATQSPWNPKGTGACENVVWLISGTDSDGVESAIDTLVNHYEDLKYAFSGVVDNGELIRIP